MEASGDINRVLSLIDAQNLPHPSIALLRCFVTEALYRDVAAEYVEARLQTDAAEDLVSDWNFIITSRMFRPLMLPFGRAWLLTHVVFHDGQPPQPLPAAIEHDIWQRDGGRCCITGKKGTFLDPLVVYPVLPIPVAWATAEVRAHSRNDGLSALTRSIPRTRISVTCLVHSSAPHTETGGSHMRKIPIQCCLI
jgi:hypothetical protein